MLFVLAVCCCHVRWRSSLFLVLLFLLNVGSQSASRFIFLAHAIVVGTNTAITTPRNIRKMEALGATHFGPKLQPHREILSFRSDLPIPLPRCPTEVRVRVCYAELNPVDLHKLSMKPPGVAVPPDRSPFVVGYGGSGVVDEVFRDGGAAAADEETARLLGRRVAFLCDSSRSGSYATHVVVDRRLVSVVPDDVTLEQAASVPLAGCTAYEALEKVGLAIGGASDEGGGVGGDGRGRTLLVVGGAGGVGSWTTLLARAAYPSLDIVCTASSPQSRSWCTDRLGASRALPHDAIEGLGEGPAGSVDHIVCLAEPTAELFSSLAEVLRPFGRICLVVAGEGVKSLDLSFVFFKSGTVATQTVFSSCRAGFVLDQAAEIGTILAMLSGKKIEAAPLMRGWETVAGTDDWHRVLEEGGALDVVASGHCQGKLIMKIGDEKEK